MTNPSAPATPFEITLTRHFEAPQQRVFDAWTTSAMLQQWWGPDQYTNASCAIDPAPGGAIHIVMHSASGREHRVGGTVHEASAPDRLEFTSLAVYDAHGTPQLECYNTVTFSETDGRTAVTLHARVVHADPSAGPAVASLELTWTQSLECLDSLLKAG